MGFLWLGERGSKDKRELGLGFEGNYGIKGSCGSECRLKVMFGCPRGNGLFFIRVGLVKG